MHVPLTLVDFLERAALVYGDRVAIVDEPDPPGGGLGQVTYAALAAMARSLAVVALQFLQQLETVHDGHHDIGDDEVR